MRNEIIEKNNKVHIFIKQAVEASKPSVIRLAAVLSLVFFDLLAIGIAIYIAYILRDAILPALLPALFAEELLEVTFEMLWWFPLAFIFTLAYEKLYHKRIPFWNEVEFIIKAATLAFFMAIAFIYILGLAQEISRFLVIMVWLLSLLLIPIARYYSKKLLLKYNIWKCPVILIGDSSSAALLSGALSREKTMGYELIGLVDIGEVGMTGQINHDLEHKLPTIKSLSEAEKVIAETNVQDVIIAAPGLPSRELVELTNRFQALTNNVIIVPDLFGITLNGIDMAYLFEEQTILLQVKNRLKSPLNRLIKRLFDLFAGTVIFILSSPILLAAAIAIKLNSKGSVFYIQERIGQGGSRFSVYKFRTMYNNADQIMENHLASNEEASREWEVFKKLRTFDPRVTKVGRFLRRFSLDELAQLINVLKGEMSLVGPRPYMPSEEYLLGSYAKDIYVTKPGLTGLWQVSGRNNLNFDSRISLDSWYVKNWSLWLDLVLLLKTLRVVIKTDGAY